MFTNAIRQKLLTALRDFSAGRILMHDELAVICILIFILITMPYYDIAQRTAAIVLKANGCSNAQITKQLASLPEQFVGVASQMLHERLWTYLLASSDSKTSRESRLCVARPSGKIERQGRMATPQQVDFLAYMNV